MNRVITCATVLTLISCALDAPKSIEPEVPEATTTVSTFGKTKVIDGYISGANIFIDMNFNLEQDPNEPSAYEDIENQLYYFEVKDFSGIQDFTINCALARPRVAQIPVGAIDSDRGEVTEAYEMYYFPYFVDGAGEQGESRANVTPLTSLFLTYIANELDSTNIADVDGCGSVANNVGLELIDRVDEVLSSLSNSFGIDAYTFYDDFIASGDETLAAYGQMVADFLQVTFKVTLLVEAEYGFDAKTQIDQLLIEQIIANEDISEFSFAFFSNTHPEFLDETFYAYDLYAFYDIRANRSGELLDAQGNIYELSIDNLKLNSNFMVREIVTTNFNIIDFKKVLLEKSEDSNRGPYHLIDISTFTGSDAYYRINKDTSKTTIWNNVVIADRWTGHEIEITNELNPYFAIEMQSVFDARDIDQLTAIYDDIKAMSSNMLDIINNQYLLYEGDRQRLVKGNWEYIEFIEDGGLQQLCTNLETNETVTGTSAFNLCSENIE